MTDYGIVVPFYNHEHAIADTVSSLRAAGLRCWLVDDGSDARCRPLLERLAHEESGWLRLVTHATNRGKGMAVVTGFEAAHAAGATHALQIDADGQHDFADIPRLLAASRREPDAIVTGVPVFDSSVPRSRLHGRKLTSFWARVNTLSCGIEDAMCGFRVYPLAPMLRLARGAGVGRRMEFDPEILVRASWAGVPIRSVPTRVTYPRDGVSHFRMGRDNVQISLMHTRLFFGMLARLPWLLLRRWRAAR